MFQLFCAFFTLLTLSVSYNLQAAERRPKAPPPILVQEVPTIGEFRSQRGFRMSFCLADNRHTVTIDMNKNTVEVWDYSDSSNPKLISTNQYQAEVKEEKKSAE